jgi:hypothetical protein
MPLDIDYQSKGFPGVMPRLKGQHTLTTSWDDLLWAAITVGRPNRTICISTWDRFALRGDFPFFIDPNGA